MPDREPMSRPRRRIAAMLTELREQSGLTLDEIAAELGWHLTKVNRISLGRRRPTPADIRQLADFYGMDDARREQLDAWREEDRKLKRMPPPWKMYEEVMSAAYRELIINEHEASRAWEFQLNTIPGLYQTPDYARAIISMGLNAYGHDQIEKLVKLRSMRQRLLFQEDPLISTGIVTEGALRALVGGRDVMREQLLHVRELAMQDNIDFRVIPFSAGAAVAQNSGVTLYQFPDRPQPEIAFVEVIGNTVVEEADPEISQFTRLIAQLEAAAASPVESIALIERVLKEMA
ncbi:helix-turn-helix domain-containing protein [Embleya sp. NPDC055664]